MVSYKAGINVDDDGTPIIDGVIVDDAGSGLWLPVSMKDGKDVIFTVRDMKLPFTAEGFLQSFSLPNFYFHATTAYDILRNKGVPVGKRDFLGRMKLKS